MPKASKTQTTQPTGASEMRAEEIENTVRLQGDGNKGQLQALSRGGLQLGAARPNDRARGRRREVNPQSKDRRRGRELKSGVAATRIRNSASEGVTGTPKPPHGSQQVHQRCVAMPTNGPRCCRRTLRSYNRHTGGGSHDHHGEGRTVTTD